MAHLFEERNVYLISYGRRFVTPVFFRLVNLICGLALGFFALKLLWSMLTLPNG
ncbi:hypothetical protein [Ktedonobacter sp. SOSP1-52]|uniref:hypothetical protein n=1 Tax=Ktedonobacter sp. SOSP1-52 TaxID=2778366 RepID=UPI0019157C66|nr:hypothetical protein [Ktedonobacter sp. SOSP1-52]